MKRKFIVLLLLVVGVFGCSENKSSNDSQSTEDSIIPITDVSLDKISEVVLKGNTLQLNVTVIPDNATDKSVIWSSTNVSSVAVSENGLVTAIDYGHANITVTTSDGNKTDVCQIIVPRENTGSLDTSFDTDGIVNSNGGIGTTPRAFGKKIYVDSTGKIYVAGIAYDSDNDLLRYLVVWKYNSDGSLDVSFATNGIFTFNYTTNMPKFNAITDIQVDSNGKVYILGRILEDDYTTNIFVIKLKSEGVLDTSFNGRGYVIYDSGNGDDYGADLHVNSDSSMFIGGYSHDGSSSVAAIIKYKADGTLDYSFDSDGVVTYKYNAFGDAAFAMYVENNGKIYLGGTEKLTSGTRGIAVYKFNSDGGFDTSFNSGGLEAGVAYEEIADINFSVNDMALDLSGNVYVTGYSQGPVYVADSQSIDNTNITTPYITVWKFTPSGVLDTSFDTDGVIRFTVTSNEAGEGKYIFADPLGQIYIRDQNFSNNNMLLFWRLNNDGSVDTTYGTNGAVSYITTGDPLADQDMFMDLDNNIYFTGYDTDTTDYWMTILKYK